MTLRDEKKCLASEAVAYTHYLKGMCGRRQKIPNPGDLVLVRNHAVDSQRGRKLEAKWLGPRLLVLYSASKLMEYIREIYSDGKAKKYPLNDILLYQEKRALFVDEMCLLAKPEGTVPTVIGEKGIREPGQRLFATGSEIICTIRQVRRIEVGGEAVEIEE